MIIFNDNLIKIKLILIIVIVLLCYCSVRKDKEKDVISVVPFDSVTTKPAITYMPEIEYPDLVRRIGIERTALVQCLIDTTGLVINVDLHKSSGNDMLDSAALNVAKSFRFSPAKHNGKSVWVWKQIGIKYFNVPKGEVSVIE